MLPLFAEGVTKGADSIYRQLLIEQFRDYEERYGCALLSRIDGGKKSALVRVVVGLMLYHFWIRIAESHSTLVSIPLTSALHFEIYHEKPSPKAGNSLSESFLDYMNYQNPHFEDPKMAPAFKFGNDIAEIMETLNISFSFMASQQAILISEITRKILDGLLLNKEAGER